MSQIDKQLMILRCCGRELITMHARTGSDRNLGSDIVIGQRHGVIARLGPLIIVTVSRSIDRWFEASFPGKWHYQNVAIV